MTARAATALLLAAVALGGCGDPGLWARYRAERALWNARRVAERLQVNPRLASPADYDRTIGAYRAVTAQFPASAWAAPGRVREPYASDVAALSGRAAVGVAHVEEMRGRLDAAVDGYTRAMADYRALPLVALEAALGRARALDRAGRAEDATSAWADVARDFPLVDPDLEVVLQPVLDAPLRVARDLRAGGRAVAADSVLRVAAARYVAELDRQHGRPPAPDLWLHLAQARAAGGAVDAAMAALRCALLEPAAASRRAEIVLQLGECALEAGRPDSARAYAFWVERGFTDGRGEGILLEARAWELRGPPDSALDAYERFLDAYGDSPSQAAVRFRRGMILERIDRWEQARSEFRALAAEQPSHPLAFAALLRIVNHHAVRGERDLARFEGRHGIETLERLIATHGDPGVVFAARRTRAEVLLLIEDYAAASQAFAELWSRYPETPAGMAAGVRAAQVAEQRLGDRRRALDLYRDLATHATDLAVQREARAAAARLERAGG